MPRQIAISDIHGCNRTLLALLDRIAFTQADELYLLGDYVDRGPDSKGVIDTIWRLQEEGYTVHCLMGNHEEMTCHDYDTEKRRGWIGLGDRELLASFGAQHMDGIPQKYIDWMRQLKRYIEIPGYILVHAGLNFKAPDPFSHPESMIWIRDWYEDINRDWLGDRLIVHGHTPMPMPLIKAMFKHHQKLPAQDIDCGAALNHQSFFSHLCAFDLTNRELVFQENVEAVT